MGGGKRRCVNSHRLPCDVQSLFQVVSVHYRDQLNSCIQTRKQRLSYTRNFRCILHVEKHHRAVQTMLWEEVSSFRLQLAHGCFKNLMQCTVFNRVIASFSWYHDFEHHPHFLPLSLVVTYGPNPPPPRASPLAHTGSCRLQWPERWPKSK